MQRRPAGWIAGFFLLASTQAAEPFFPEAQTAMRAAKTVRIEVEQEFPNPNADNAEEPESPEEDNRPRRPVPPPPPFLDVELPLAKDAGELFQALGLKPVAEGAADLMVRVKAEGNAVSATYNMIGTQYAGASLKGRLTFLLDGREFAETDFNFTYDRPDVIVVTTYNGIPGGGPASSPKDAPFQKTLPAFYRALLEFAGRGLGAERIAQALKLPDAEMRAAACLALGDLAAPEAAPALIPLAEDQESTVRAAAAWALGQLKKPAAIPALLASLGKFDEYPATRRHATDGLNSSPRPSEEIESSEQERMDHYLTIRTHGPEEIFQREFGEQGYARPYLLGALAELARDNPDGVRLLREALKSGRSADSKPHLRSGAALVLGKLKSREAHDDIVAQLSGDRYMKMAAVTALGALADVRSVEPLLVQLAREETAAPKPAAPAGQDQETAEEYSSPLADAMRSALQSVTGQNFQHVREWRAWWRANRERLLAAPAK